MRVPPPHAAAAILLSLILVSTAPRPSAGDEFTTPDRAGEDWWAFQTVKKPVPPRVDGQTELDPIDLFVQDRLLSEGMTPAPEADRRTLIRRLHLDLTGLPPNAAEVEQFLEDRDPLAYEKLVDRLLDSPRFGERWARHWLDVVRYAETNGYERDAVKPNLWKYRDWVIEAFNRDMPYDRFIREQIAGDEIPGRSQSSVIATGMLRAGTWNDEPNDPQEYKYERLEDMVDVVTTSFLAVTVKCARCHDHKFDPIPQRDYYRLAAAFWPGAIEPRDRKLMGGPTEEELGVPGVFGWTDIRREPPPLHLLINGDPHRPGDLVKPGLLSLVPTLNKELPSPPPEAATSRRRLHLAEFIGSKRNPLTARVMVNRIWQHLFGQGIVRTPNNFGFKASPPTHPKLLDWLAAEFMEGDWSIKQVIRQIVLTRTYRQHSIHPMEMKYADRDAENRLLWKMNRRRLDAEALRDSLLTVTGELNLTEGGPSFYPEMPPEALEGFSRKGSAWPPSPPRERLRRSIYMMSKRHLLLPLMTAFDFPNSEKPCGKRDVTTVAPQALAMMNNRFVHDRSEHLARQLLEKPGSPRAAIRTIWRRILARDPSHEELAGAWRHHQQQLDHFRNQRDEAKIDGKPGAPGTPNILSDPALRLRLDAGAGLTLDATKRLATWSEVSGTEIHAFQKDPSRRPAIAAKAIGGRPAVRFSGEREFLELEWPGLHHQACTILAVAADHSDHQGHRALLSNWNGTAGNSVSSLFLGLTGKGTVRFSDDFASAHPIDDPGRPFVLAASTGPSGTFILHNGTVIGSRSNPLSKRRLDTEFVIGQQGNIEGEFWEGDIAEFLVYDRQLDREELVRVSELLGDRYGIPIQADAPSPPARTPELLALASLCHVLMNSNEFLHVD